MAQMDTYEKRIESIRGHLEKEYDKTELSGRTKIQHIDKLMLWIQFYSNYTINNPPEIEIEKSLDTLIEYSELGIKILHSRHELKHTPQNHHVYIGAVVSYIKHIIKRDDLLEKWKKEEKQNFEPIQQRMDEGRPSEIQMDCIMTVEEIELKRKELEKGSKERLLLSMYTLIEPVRADYFSTRIISKEEYEDMKEVNENENIIIKESDDEWKLSIKDFKTKNMYKEIKKNLSGEILEEIKESLRKQPRKYLFVQRDGKTPYKRESFSEWACRTLTKGLNHKMTLTVLRHIYIVNAEKTKTGREMTEIATQMGHSRGMQRVYAWNEKEMSATKV
jgi:integrase